MFRTIKDIRNYNPKKDLEENVIRPLKEKFLRSEREKLFKSYQAYSEELNRQSEKLWGLKKEILVLAGVIFGSSLALAVGQEPKLVFILGTGLLLLIILLGIFITHTEIAAQRWWSTLLQKGNLELYLKMNENMINKEEKEIVEEELRILQEELKRKSLSEKILRISKIKIDWLHSAFFIGFIFALFLIWFSLI